MAGMVPPREASWRGDGWTMELGLARRAAWSMAVGGHGCGAGYLVGSWGNSCRTGACLAVVSPVTAGMPDVLNPDGASEVLVSNDAPVNTVGCETIAVVSMDVDVVGDVKVCR